MARFFLQHTARRWNVGQHFKFFSPNVSRKKALPFSSTGLTSLVNRSKSLKRKESCDARDCGIPCQSCNTTKAWVKRACVRSATGCKETLLTDKQETSRTEACHHGNYLKISIPGGELSWLPLKLAHKLFHNKKNLEPNILSILTNYNKTKPFASQTRYTLFNCLAPMILSWFSARRS